MIQFDEHIFQMGWFNHQPDQLYDWSDFLAALDHVFEWWVVGIPGV